MKLIEKSNINGIEFKFYDGIDIKIALNHPKDGSDGFLYFFIDNWENLIKIENRNNIIDSILGQKLKNENINDINNGYVLIYQTSGDMMKVYEIIRDNIDTSPNRHLLVKHTIDK